MTMMASISSCSCSIPLFLHFHSDVSSLLLPAAIYKSKQQQRISTSGLQIRGAKLDDSCRHLGWWNPNPNPPKLNKKILIGLCSCFPSSNDDNKPIGGDDEVDVVDIDNKSVMVVEDSEKKLLDTKKFRETIATLTPTLLVVKQHIRSNFAAVLCIALAVLVIAVREYVARKSGYDNRQGSVADLVKRGQLRSDRRGISKPLKYDDPFNNPLVKVSKNSSSVEMCGKVYRLAPVTLTVEEQSSHQKRRSRAYQWKRPTMFLKEGDMIPPDVDPDTVRWIPANHPFATTVNEIDEDLAQNNVYQKHGVPFRIKAEHEALQKKLESLQNEQKLNKLVIDPSNARDFEKPFKSSSKSSGREERRTPNQEDGADTPKSDRAPFDTNTTSEK